MLEIRSNFKRTQKRMLETLLKKVGENEQVMNTVFGNMTMQEVLNCRRTCKLWNEMILTSPNSHLVQKALISFKSPSNVKQSKLLSKSRPTTQNQNCDTSIYELNTNTFVEFHFPNYKFTNVDIRTPNMQQFFDTNGHFIEHLVFDSCITSSNSFVRILKCCKNLIHLHITKMNQINIRPKENIKEDEEGSSLLPLTTLETFRIEANPESSSSNPRIYARTNQSMIESFGFSAEQLIHLIGHNKFLRSIEIAGVEYGTVIKVLSILGQNKQNNVTSLKFREILTSFQPWYLYEVMKQLKHLKIRIFELGFTNTAKENIDFTELRDFPIPTQQSQFDSEGNRRYDEQDLTEFVAYSILAQHRKTLEELCFTNIGVSENIFVNSGSSRMFLPKLKLLKLGGTNFVRIPTNPKEIFGRFDDPMKIYINGKNMILPKKKFGFQRYTRREEVMLILFLGLALVLSHLMGNDFGWLLGFLSCVIILTVYNRFR